MSCQRGQGSTEIHYLCTSYQEAIKEYYDYMRMSKSDFLESVNKEYWFMYLYKFPLSVNFAYLNGKNWSETKLSKSSKYRIKFKTWGDLINEYKITNRNKAIDDIIDQ